jgi:phosphoethanolamine N-methyltransferase
MPPSGPLYERLAAQLGEEFTRHEIEVWRALTVVLDSGELRPTHLRAGRP